VYILRCTQKLLKRMRLEVDDLRGNEPEQSTTALGDWYGYLLIQQRQQLVILVNEHSRLCIFTPARDISHLTDRLQDSLDELLHTLDIPEVAIERELHEMGEVAFGLTSGVPLGRSILGSINDYVTAMRYHDLSERSLPEWNIRFSEWICGPLGYKRPGEIAGQLLVRAVSDPE
jgi:hypothetical protein